ncbi:TPM domain-containing protein [Spirochaetia bacterium 38H-sp]|uniref:TPM domain-containing protein n=1 Tax=Rarispira pelagica TaxID=3141764 RepID=A0ABU9UCS3_9SPIR
MEVGKRSANPVFFLTKEEQNAVLEAIKEVESRSICEIRVHIARSFKGDVLDAAKRVFNKLGMYKTRKRTGVLLYFAVKNKAFAIIGDKGINEKAGEDFWRDTAVKMEEFFRQGRFGEGIVAGIREVGAVLEKYFPYEAGDTNELPDDISFGK